LSDVERQRRRIMSDEHHQDNRALAGRQRDGSRSVTGDAVVSRLSAEGVDALRFAGQRQLTRWGRRELSVRDAQRRQALTDALRALAPLKHCDCELRRLTTDDEPRMASRERRCGGEGV
jgi:hypothetical protein